jgi:hypothetical protein
MGRNISLDTLIIEVFLILLVVDLVTEEEVITVGVEKKLYLGKNLKHLIYRFDRPVQRY